MEGSRPLVKFQSGNVEAELVKIWGASNPIDTALGFVTAAGWFRTFMAGWGPGREATASIGSEVNSAGNLTTGNPLEVSIRKILTPASEIAPALRQSVPKLVDKASTSYGALNPVAVVRPESQQTRVINGHQALTFLVDVTSESGRDGVITKKPLHRLLRPDPDREPGDHVFINISETTSRPPFSLWEWDPIFATAKIPQ